MLTIGRLAADQAGARPYHRTTAAPIQDHGGAGRDALPRDPRAARPMVMSGVPPPMVEALRRVRRRTACLERVCGRAAPDAPERVYDQRRCTGC